MFMSNLSVKPTAPILPASAPAAPAPQTATPTASAPAAAPSALAEGDQLKTYTVKKGDNLWNIAKKELGDPTRWKAIHQLNTASVRNPDLIYPNQILKLPIAVTSVPAQPVQPVPAPPTQPVTPPAPPAVEPTPVASEPIQPAPPSEPVKPAPPAVVPKPDQNIAPAKPKSNGVAMAAAIGGTIGVVGTGGALIGITRSLGAPLANLGGYGTAQVVAGKLASIGLAVPQGPALTKLVSSIGGPKVAGAAVAVGVGLAAAGIAAGGYYLYQKTKD